MSNRRQLVEKIPGFFYSAHDRFLAAAFHHERPMNLTSSHTKYFPHELTKRCSSDSMEKLAGGGQNVAGCT